MTGSLVRLPNYRSVTHHLMMYPDKWLLPDIFIIQILPSLAKPILLRSFKPGMHKQQAAQPDFSLRTISTKQRGWGLIYGKKR